MSNLNGLNFLSSDTTGVSPGALVGTKTVILSQTIRDRVDEWWLTPLKEMKDHEAFVCLTVCLPLLERIIRFETSSPDSEFFSQGSTLIKELAQKLSLKPDDAHDFWQMFRNGIAHRAMPQLYKDRTYELTDKPSAPVQVSGSHFLIHPWKLRDLVVALVERNRKMWNDKLYPLANVYRPSN